MLLFLWGDLELCVQAELNLITYWIAIINCKCFGQFWFRKLVGKGARACIAAEQPRGVSLIFHHYLSSNQCYIVCSYHGVRSCSQLSATGTLCYVWQVLDLLEEVAFEAEFLATRIEKERRAIQAEAQMMNTIEYRVDCQLLQYLHEENALGFRFPIGKMEQVSACTLACL